MLIRYFSAPLILTLGITASPVIVLNELKTLSVGKRVSFSGSGNLAQRDRDRAKALFNLLITPLDAHDDLESDADTVLVNNTGVTYVAQVGVGNPPTTYNLLVDTGSSNTWIGAGKPYIQTDTSKATIDSVSVGYGSGSFSGKMYMDVLRLGDLIVEDQYIGVASRSSGFEGFDGILGVGPVGLTSGTSWPDFLDTVPTVTDKLVEQGTIPANLLAVSYKPTGVLEVSSGELTFGRIDPSQYQENLDYHPITATFPSSNYWGINQGITYGQDQTPILKFTAGIIDTGTTLCLIASDAFAAYKKATGASIDVRTGLLTVTDEQYAALRSLYFNVGDKTYELTPNAQRWPKALNPEIGGQADAIYLIVGDFGTVSGQGLDFINGYGFLERFYSVFDADSKRIGLAYTHWTFSEVN